MQLNYLYPWEVDRIRKWKDWETVPWSDEEAIKRYPKYAWVYDKKEFNERIDNLTTLDANVILKPKVNLLGMSLGAGRLKKDNFVIQEFIEGTHYTVDAWILNSLVVEYFVFRAQKDHNGSFTSFTFENIELPPTILEKIRKIDLNGRFSICFEFIDDKIIDFHLRPSLQYWDICDNFTKNSIDFLKGKNPPPLNKNIRAVSQVFRLNGKRNTMVYLDEHRCEKLVEQSPGVKSVERYFYKDFPLDHYELIQDEFSDKYLTINADSKSTACLFHEKLLREGILIIEIL